MCRWVVLAGCIALTLYFASGTRPIGYPIVAGATALVPLLLTPRLPFALRATMLLATAYVLSTLGLFLGGLLLGPGVGMVGTVVMATVLFGRRASYLALAVTTSTLLVVGMLYDGAHITPATGANPELAAWARASLGFFMGTTVVALSIGHLLERLVATVRSSGDLVDDLMTQVRARDAAIAAREEAEARLRHAQKMEALGTLSAGIAHDFNNTLTVMLSGARFLRKRPHLDPREQRIAMDIESAARSAARLTRQLLAFGRRDVIEPRRIDIRDLLSDTKSLLSRLLPATIEVRLEVDDGLPPVRTDPTQLEQAILNLAINARDAMPDGGALTVRGESRRLDEEGDLPAGDYVAIVVADTGVGMDEETKARAFEPFFTTKGPGRGTGLGLAMVFAIAQESGGHVQIDSEVGVGTRFTIWLPAAAGPLSEPTKTTMLDSDPDHPPSTILVAEDHPGVRASICRALEDAGYVVLEAADGREAQTMTDQHQGEIQLLCTDAVMPGVDGRHLAQSFLKRRPDGMVLVCSGYVAEEELRTDLEGGSYAFLRKPFTDDALVKKVREVLEFRHAKHAAQNAAEAPPRGA